MRRNDIIADIGDLTFIEILNVVDKILMWMTSHRHVGSRHPYRNNLGIYRDQTILRLYNIVLEFLKSFYEEIIEYQILK